MTITSPELIDELRTQISAHHLDSVADYLIDTAVECYAILLDGPDDYSEVGNSRAGGEPDLPEGFSWPCEGNPDESESRFSNFIAQINFAELPPLACPTPLPDSGILQLFVRSMESAAEPVLLDTHFYSGPSSSLQRVSSPSDDRLQVEYLLDLRPQRIVAVPSISFPGFRREFRNTIASKTVEVDGKDGNWRRHELEAALRYQGEVGRILGYANCGDERENLYRQICLSRMNKRRLVCNDYWSSLEEYENYIRPYRERGEDRMVEFYERMREGVKWLVENRTEIAKDADEWQLLCRIDSNSDMNLWINDADPLYTFIRSSDLERRDFSDMAGEVTQG